MAHLVFILILSTVCHVALKSKVIGYDSQKKIFKIKAVTIENNYFNLLSLIINYILLAYYTL